MHSAMRGTPLYAQHLAEHQRRFVQLVVAADAPRRLVLVSPPGYGKSTAVAAAVQSVVARRPSARVLVIGPAALLAQWAALIREGTGTDVRLVNAPEYRRLQLRTQPGGNPWATAGVYLTSPEFLRRHERAGEVATVAWDLVVVEELHLFQAGMRRELLRRLWAAPAIRQIVATTPAAAAVHDEAREAVIVAWDTRVLAEQYAQRIPARVIHGHTVAFTAEERVFREAVRALSARASGSEGQQAPAARVLLQRMSSSLFAVEQTLRRAKAVADAWDPRAEGPDEWVTGDADAEGRYDARPEWRAEGLADALARLEEIESDSKWAVCLQLLRGIASTQGERPVIIYTDFADTAEYLEELVGSRGWPVFVLSGRVPPELRPGVIEEARRTRGAALIVSAAGTQGLELTITDCIVHYDLPADVMRLVQRFSRIERLGIGYEEVHHHMLLQEGGEEAARLVSMINEITRLEHGSKPRMLWD